MEENSSVLAKKSGNPNWKKGMASPGVPRNHMRVVNGMGLDGGLSINGLPAMQKRLARFMKGKLSTRWLEEWFDELSPREQLTFINVALPYLLQKPAPPAKELTLEERMTDQQVLMAYKHLTESK